MEFIDYRDSNLSTSLTSAIVDGNVEIVEYLLKQGVDPNLQGDDGDTPLIIAVNHHSSTSIARLLLQYGANLTTQNRYGDTPFTIAIRYSPIEYEYEDVLRLLMVSITGEYLQ